MRRHARIALLLATSFPFLAGSAALSQTGAADQKDVLKANGKDQDALGPAFEVASIRQAVENNGRTWFGVQVDRSGRFQGSSVSVSQLVSIAYAAPPNPTKVQADHAAPNWINSENFDIAAKVDSAYLSGWNTLSDDQRMEAVRPMIRRLLADRFHVRLDLEIRTTPVYALVQAKGGARVKQVDPPPAAEDAPTHPKDRSDDEAFKQGIPGAIVCSSDKCIARAMKISTATGQIAANSHADRMVIDQTGLSGYYDFSFSFPGDKSEFPMGEVANDLGMKFEARSVPVKTYVIRSAEKPSVD